MLKTWKSRFEAVLWVAVAEALEWVHLASDLRRRIYQLSASIDVLEQELDIVFARRRRDDYGAN